MVPVGFAACCDTFVEHVAACAHDVRYEWWSRDGQWVIAIAESAGGGGVEISFCPHCGKKL